MENGNPGCTIIVGKNAGPVEKHAAKELSKFLAKISEGKAPGIAETAAPETLPVRYELTNDKRVADEGFMIRAKAKEIVIAGKQPIGFLYGSYYILKKYGGIRWLVPGDDGEYFTVRKTIAVPEGEYISNPSFEYRSISWGVASVLSLKWDSFDWMVRNNLRIFDMHYTIMNKSLWSGLEERGFVIQDGGHCFSDLLGGHWVKIKTWKEFNAHMETLFKEHPEYFPVINGKRTFLEGEKYQPCTSNPEVIRIMSENLILNLKELCSKTPGGRYRLVNNDGTGWCECEECKKLDRGDKGMTNRYWTFINTLADRAFKEVPDAIINTIAYQNYQDAPTDILPDKRLATVELSFNRICYRHKIDDPDCVTNRLYFKKYNDWLALSKKHGYKLVTYAQIDSLGYHGMPIEGTYLHDIKYYHDKLGAIGVRPQLAPVDGKYSPRFDQLPMIKLEWYAIWQTLYGFAQLSWDVNADIDKMLEETGALYYGKAWNAGMREYRKTLSKAFLETPGCYGYGHSSPLGRCLDRPGVHEKLLACLASAEKAAKDDPDKRALAHVQRDREIFALTWEKFRKDYLANHREVRSYHKQKPIKIDGVLDEFDWMNADTVSGFKRTDSSGALAENQTFVRVVHEEDFIYFGIEAMEPAPEKMITEITKRDGPVWTDSTLELFLNHPDLGNAYYQIIVNSKGVVFDQFVKPGLPNNTAFDSQIEVKTKILKDRWVLEARIPTGPLGEKCFDGQAWKVNVLRSRKIKGQLDASGNPTESSTWSLGSPHDTGTFQPVNFCAARSVTRFGDEPDDRQFKNGSFNEVSKRKASLARENFNIRDGIIPEHWEIGPGTFSLESDPANPDNKYIVVDGNIANVYTGKDPAARIMLRVKGKGQINLSWYCFDVVKNQRTQRKIQAITSAEIAADDWQELRFETEVPAFDLNKLFIRAVPEKDAKIMIDYVYITPLKKVEK